MTASRRGGRRTPLCCSVSRCRFAACAGSAQFITVLRKPPILWPGALLGWIAGKMAANDALVLTGPMPPALMADFAPLSRVLAALIVLFI